MRVQTVGLCGNKVLAGLCLGALVLLPVSAARAEEQLLLNPHFEEPELQEGQRGVVPENWFTFSNEGDSNIRTSRDTAKEGAQSLRFTSQGRADAFQGACQVMSVEAGSNYEFATHIQIPRQGATRNAVRGQLSIEWRNEREEEITRSWGPVWTEELSPGTWSEFSLTARAPEGAVSAVFVITQFDSGDVEDLGVFYADAVGVWKLP